MHCRLVIGLIAVALICVLSISPANAFIGLQDSEYKVLLKLPVDSEDDSTNEELSTDETESKADEDDDDGMKTSFEATHQETDFLKPTLDGEPVTLNTFELDDQGNVWACVSLVNKPKTKREGASDVNDGNEASVKAQGYILVYSPEKLLVRQIPIPFSPTAIDLDPSGTVYAAGEGKICKMTAEGKILLAATTPNMAGKDIEDLRSDAMAAYQKQMEQTAERIAKQKEQLDEKIAEVEEIDEAERSKRQTAQLKSYRQQQSQLDQFSPPDKMPDDLVDQLVESKFGVPSLCSTANHVFVTTSATEGFGYSIWRTDVNFENPKEVIDQVSGCCGQMDVEADADRFYVADNTKFAVSVYDHDGKKLDSFGKRVGKDDNGFGSCCNPMNVCCAKNGDILAAESSIGKIKRFDPTGKMIGYVGQARIGAGCKHVAVAYDESRDRYYIQYQDKNQICILIPNSEAADVIAEKRALEEILLKATKPFFGRWIRESQAASPDGDKPKEEIADSDTSFQIDFETLASQIDEFEILENGKFRLKLAGQNPFLNGVKNCKWVPENADEQGIVTFGLEADGLVVLRMQVKLESDNQTTVSVFYEGAGGTPKFESFNRGK